MKLQPNPLTSSLGTKYLMALTGLALIGFVLGHMGGNLLIYAGPDALNSYAHGLKSKPALLWGARLGLLAVFVVHVSLAFRLRYLNALARPTRYRYEDTLQASWASRHMMLTGLLLLAFIVYHLAHFTLGVVKPATTQVVNGKVESFKDIDPSTPTRHYLSLAEVHAAGSKDYIAAPRVDLNDSQSLKDLKDRSPGAEVRHDVYSMVVAGFRNPFVAASYLLAMVFLGLHLWHGGSSWLQSLGLNAPGYDRCVRWIGPVLAAVVVAGNSSIPIYVLLQFGVQW